MPDRKLDNFPIVDQYEYQVNDNIFVFKSDYTFEDLDWLDVVYNKLTVQKDNNSIAGKFTREEINKTLKTLLINKDGSEFTDEDFLKAGELQSVKIIADFFLLKAFLGTITKSVSMN